VPEDGTNGLQIDVGLRLSTWVCRLNPEAMGATSPNLARDA